MATIAQISSEQSGKFGLDLKREYTRTYRVTTGSLASDEWDVLSALVLAGLGPGTAYPKDGAALCVSNQVRRENDSAEGIWTATVTWSTEYEDPNQNVLPLSRPPVYKVSFEKQNRIIEEDKNGTALLNTAGMPFENFEIEQGILIVSIEANYDFDTASLDAWREFFGKCNDDEWHGIPQDGARILNIQADEQTEAGQHFWHVSWQIGCNADLWQPVRVLNAGTVEVKDGEWKNIKDVHGNNIQQAVPLALDGTALPPGADPVWKEFFVYDRMTFENVVP